MTKTLCSVAPTNNVPIVKITALRRDGTWKATAFASCGE